MGVQFIGFGMLPVLYGIHDDVFYHGARIVSKAVAEWIVDETEVGLRHDLYTGLTFLSFQNKVVFFSIHRRSGFFIRFRVKKQQSPPV